MKPHFFVILEKENCNFGFESTDKLLLLNLQTVLRTSVLLFSPVHRGRFTFNTVTEDYLLILLIDVTPNTSYSSFSEYVRAVCCRTFTQQTAQLQ